MKLSPDQIANLESRILRQVRAHPGISRIALSRKLRIAPSTVGNYVGRLMTEGFLAESEPAESEAGRPPTALRLHPDGGQFIGVDFEARNILAMAVDFADRPLKQTHLNIQASDDVAEIIQKIEQAIMAVVPANPSRFLAVGVGVPGFVDPLRGIARHYKYLKNWRNVALAAPLAKRFGVPVYLENNVRSMALAELWFGQGRGVEDFICLGIRSGIGAGIVAGGQPQRGAEYQAGEIGRWRAPWPRRAAARFFRDPDAPPAVEVELQEVASVRALLAALERARRQNEKTLLAAQHNPLTMAEVEKAARQQDRLTAQVIGFAGEMLGWAVADLALAFNPARVILAGPLTRLGDTLLQPLRERAAEILHTSGTEPPAIVNSTMGEYGGALGAAALAVHEWKPAR